MIELFDDEVMWFSENGERFQINEKKSERFISGKTTHQL